MPSLADFERDYWAPDREEVLARMRAEQQQAPAAPPQEAIYGGAGYYDPTRGEFDPGWGIEMGGGGYDPYTSYQAPPQQAPPPPSTYEAPPYYDPGTVNTHQYTPEQAEYDRFARDYWSPDREQVLASMRPQPAQLPGNWQGGGGYYGGGIAGGGAGGYRGQTAGGGGFDENALSQAWLSSGGRTPQDLANFFAANPQLVGGATLVGSKKDKIQLPNGRVVDAVLASGAGGRGAQWLVEGGGGGGGGQAGGVSYGQAPNPTPFNYEKFQAPGAFTYEDFKAPTPFEGPAWVAPTGVSDANDPGYTARLQEGQQALERSAASRGTLLTGGTAKALEQYAQDYAANEYQNVYNRGYQDYTTNYQRQMGEYNQAAEAAYRDYMTSRQNEFQNYQTNYENALNAYQTNFETQFKPWEANYQQAYNSWLGNFNAGQQGFQNQLAKENQRYQQLYGLAGLGLQATGQQAQYGQGYASNLGNIYGNYGQSMGDLITGAGNAGAAGQVGAANAAAGAWGNVGNMASMYGLYSMMGNQRTGGGGGSGNYYDNSW